MAVITNELATTASGAVCLCAAGCLVFGVCLGLKIEVDRGGGSWCGQCQASPRINVAKFKLALRPN